jgi:ubiquinone/menaquinone biosynthesis C-methylase UbiE
MIMRNSVEKWLRDCGEKFLRRAGIQEGCIVLDFGCGSGNYTIPAAAIVGSRGKVYALDKEAKGFWPSEGLDKLIMRARCRKLENIVVMKTSGELEIALEDGSVDVVLLYDVLHQYYFPEGEDRRKLLQEVHRVLRPNGFISLYPGDPEVSGDHSQLEILKMDIKNADFYLQRKLVGTVIHEDVIQRGHIWEFRKKGWCDP